MKQSKLTSKNNKENRLVVIRKRGGWQNTSREPRVTNFWFQNKQR